LGHHHHAHATGWVLRLSLIATLSFTAFEIYAGFRAHSLALLSDAGHNFTDAVALLLAAIGVYFQSRPADQTKTYGYQRAGVLTAFINALTLLILSGFIVWEAVQRLIHPTGVDDKLMMWVSLLALLLNVGIMLALRQSKSHDLNIRAAFIHMMGDALGAVAILVGALVIRFTGWLYIDPILSIALAGLIIYTAWDITNESLNILLEGLPRNLNLDQVTAKMSGVQGVLDVHDLHIWSLGSEIHALSSHVLIEDMPPSASQTILKCLQEVLCTFGIHHSTIQFEHLPCVLSDQGCRMENMPGHTHTHEHSHDGKEPHTHIHTHKH
jgi:cobalt-zinc-cadmium efflux system protein